MPYKKVIFPYFEQKKIFKKKTLRIRKLIYINKWLQSNDPKKRQRFGPLYLKRINIRP